MKKLMLSIIISAILLTPAIDFIRYPECYITTWRYQLKNKIAKGDTLAIEYYESTYVANNRELFK